MTIYYCSYSSDGTITGSGVAFGDSIPENTVECTQEQAEQYYLYVVSNGAIVNSPTYDKQRIAQAVSNINAAIQAKLDGGASDWGYDNLATAASYATSSNTQYAADAKALIDWRDAVWAWAIPKFSDVTPGEDPATFMQDMPVQPPQPKA